MITSGTILNIFKNADDDSQLKDDCVVIYNLLFFGFLPTDEAANDAMYSSVSTGFGIKQGETIGETLQRFEHGVLTRRGFKKLDKILKGLVSLGVKNMGANLLMTNIPRFTHLADGSEEEVGSIHIYDTLEQFAAPKNVIKMSNNTYVVFFNKKTDADNVADILNGMHISGHPIGVYSFEPNNYVNTSTLTLRKTCREALEKERATVNPAIVFRIIYNGALFFMSFYMLLLVARDIFGVIIS